MFPMCQFWEVSIVTNVFLLQSYSRKETLSLTMKSKDECKIGPLGLMTSYLWITFWITFYWEKSMLSFSFQFDFETRLLSVEVAYGGLSELGAECLFFGSILLHGLMTFLLKLACFEFFCDFGGWLPFCFWEEQIDENCWNDQDSNKDEEAKRTKKHLERKIE